MGKNSTLGGALSVILDGVWGGVKMGVKYIILDIIKEKTEELEKKERS